MKENVVVNPHTMHGYGTKSAGALGLHKLVLIYKYFNTPHIFNEKCFIREFPQNQEHHYIKKLLSQMCAVK